MQVLDEVEQRDSVDRAQERHRCQRHHYRYFCVPLLLLSF